jgi:hypothetical protein
VLSVEVGAGSIGSLAVRVSPVSSGTAGSSVALQAAANNTKPTPNHPILFIPQPRFLYLHAQPQPDRIQARPITHAIHIAKIKQASPAPRI